MGRMEDEDKKAVGIEPTTSRLIDVRRVTDKAEDIN
jgi:hypothetical protein